MRYTLAAILAVALIPGACQRPEADPNVTAGQRLAERHCAECHTITGRAASPMADAQPFTELARRLDMSTFARAYSSGMFEGHPRMPLIQLDPDELTELSAFLESL